VDDPLTAVLREGARRLLAQAVEAEAEAFLASMRDARLPDGRDRIVRHGYGPQRVIQTGIGPVAVRRVKLRDRDAAESGERVRFTSAILPRWSRRTRSLDALLPILYLRGVSAGDFQEALAALLGKDAPNLSPSVIGRLAVNRRAKGPPYRRPIGSLVLRCWKGGIGRAETELWVSGPPERPATSLAEAGHLSTAVASGAGALRVKRGS